MKSIGEECALCYGKLLRKQPLEDLAEIFKTLQGKEKIQDPMVRKSQILDAVENVFMGKTNFLTGVRSPSKEQ